MDDHPPDPSPARAAWKAPDKRPARRFAPAGRRFVNRDPARLGRSGRPRRRAPRPSAPCPGILPAAPSVMRAPLPIMCRMQATPPVDGPAYLYGRPLEGFIPSRFSHSGANVAASERPAASLRASVSADGRLGLLHRAGLAFRSPCFGTTSWLMSARRVPVDCPASAAVAALGAGLIPTCA